MSAPLILVAGFALVTALLAWTRWLAGRRWAAAGNLVLALAAISMVATLWPVAGDLASYQPMRSNQPVAEMFFEQAGAHRYRATLTRLPSGRMQVFELEGDEWRLGARGLDWTPRAAALGLEPAYRLDILEARSTEAEAVPAAEPARFTLHEARGSDLWARLDAGSRWSAVAMALKIEGPWQPMAHRQRFNVRLDGTAALAVVPGRATSAESITPAR
jgi:hypothetical protein